MNKKNSILIPILIILLFGCNRKQTESETAINKSTNSTQIESSEKQFLLNNHLTMAVLFHQKSAEMRALSYQAFNLAKLMLDKDLENKTIEIKRAVVVDIDETVLDNSPYEAKCILDDILYPELWNEWCNLAEAKPLPGAIDFLEYVRANGVDVFYITNRKEELREATIENLKKYNFPLVDDTYLLMRTKCKSKELRRQKVLENHHISLLVGDNLNDFVNTFEGKSIKDCFALTDEMQNEFGRRFILLPNAMYGEWESAMYDYNYNISDVEKSQKRFESLKGFNQQQAKK